MYATAGGGTVIPRGVSNSDYNRVDLNYQPNGNQTRHFFTSRLDYNITSNHHFSFVYNYDKYTSIPDFLNNIVAAFPDPASCWAPTSRPDSAATASREPCRCGRSSAPASPTNGAAALNGGTVLFFPTSARACTRTWKGYRPISAF